MSIDPLTMNTTQIMEALFAKAMPGMKLVGFAAPCAAELAVKAPFDFQIEKKGMKVNFFGSTPEKTPSGMLRGKNYGATNYTSTEATINMVQPREVDNIAADSFYSAAKLASYSTAAGGSHETTNEVLKAVYGDGCPSVESFMPAMKESWNVRALVPSGKSHHVLFGEKEVVSTITLDSSYAKRSEADEAVDWGRVNCSLKYLGAVNLMFDRKLCEVVGSLMFVMPKHNWPIMPKASFRLRVDLKKMPKPMISNPFLRPMEESSDFDLLLLEKLDNAKKYAESATDMPAAYLEAAKTLALRRIWNRKTLKLQPISVKEITGGVLLEPPSLADIREKYTDTFMKEYRQAMARILGRELLLEPKARQGMASLVQSSKSPFLSDRRDNLSFLSEILFTPKVLKKVGQELANLGYHNATTQLLSRWSALAGAPLDISERGYFKPIAKLAKHDPKALSDHLMSIWLALPYAAYDFRITTAIGEPEEVIQKLIDSVRENFLRVRDFWALKYNVLSQEASNKKLKVTLQQLSKAFKNVTMTSLMMYPKLLSEPGEQNFLHTAGIKYAKKRKISIDKKRVFNSLIEIALYLDSLSKKPPIVTWETIASSILQKTDQLRHDLIRILNLHNVKILEENYAFDEGPFKIAKAKKVSLEVAEVVEEVVEFDMGGMSFDFVGTAMKTRDDYGETLATWDDDDAANERAVEEGFANFREWYDADPSNPDLMYDPDGEMFSNLMISATTIPSSLPSLDLSDFSVIEY